MRVAPHTLSEESESVIAAAGDMLNGPQAIRTQLVFSDLPRTQVVLSNGPVKVDDQAFTSLRNAPNRQDRKAVFDAFFGGYKVFESTLGASLASQVQGDIFTARSRKFDNSLQSSLSVANIPEGVYRTLIAETTAGLPALHRYFDVRRKLLGLQDLHYYDLYSPITEIDRTFTLDDARQLTLAAVGPLGADYVETLGRATAARWMDPYPRKGKLSGAYTNPGAYDVHPYLLLNHTGSYESVSTFAHEWGHAMHSLLAKQAQPYETSRYTLFTAEIASTNNEQLLARFMYENAKSKKEKLFYLDALLELLRGTFFRQVMFAEFELQIHETAERGEGLSGEKLSAMYLALLRKYHGDAVVIDPAYAMEWAYIPHFYRNFYVYQYATSLAASAYFSDRVMAGGESERKTYLGVLRAGGSDFPVEILKRAGLDMTSPTPYRALIAKFTHTLDLVEALTASGG